MAVKRFCDICDKEVGIFYNQIELREEQNYPRSFEVCTDCLFKVKQLLGDKNKGSF